jgi:hypothetical protein
MILGGLYDKLIAGGLAVALAVSIGVNIKQAFDKRDLRTQVSTLDKQINDPKTGYVARLGTCRANVATLEKALSDQNESIAISAAKGAQAIARATEAVADAQEITRDAQRRVDRALTKPIEGADELERARNVDAQILGSLK